MTREQAEAQIYDKILEIEEIYKKYYPGNTSYLNMTIVDGAVLVNNKYYDKKSVDEHYPINFCKRLYEEDLDEYIVSY
jgi:hypothetical protein